MYDGRIRGVRGGEFNFVRDELWYGMQVSMEAALH